MTKICHLETQCATFKNDCGKLSNSLFKANKTMDFTERNNLNTSAEYENKLSSKDAIIKNVSKPKVSKPLYITILFFSYNVKMMNLKVPFSICNVLLRICKKMSIFVGKMKRCKMI